MKGFRYVKIRDVASLKQISATEQVIGRSIPLELRTVLTTVSNGGNVYPNQIRGHLASVQVLLGVGPDAYESISLGWARMQGSVPSRFLPFAYCEFGDYLGLDAEDRVVFWNYETSRPGDDLEIVCQSLADLDALVETDDMPTNSYINPEFRYLFPEDE